MDNKLEEQECDCKREMVRMRFSLHFDSLFLMSSAKTASKSVSCVTFYIKHTDYLKNIFVLKVV